MGTIMDKCPGGVDAFLLGGVFGDYVPAFHFQMPFMAEVGNPKDVRH